MPDPLTVITTGVKVYKVAEELGLIAKLTALFRKKYRVIVLGSTGAGKSQFIGSLRQEVPKLIDRMHRTEGKPPPRRLAIGTELFEFQDTPGQIIHAQTRRGMAREALKREFPGIINVVAYGYHEFKDEGSVALDEHGNVRPDFLETNRDLEIELLSEWGDLLGDDPDRWLITLVTKADLWWGQRTVVRKYYETGKYAQALKSTVGLNHTVCEYSSLTHLFWGSGEVSGKFDHEERRSLRINLLSTLFTKIGKSTEDN